MGLSLQCKEGFPFPWIIHAQIWLNVGPQNLTRQSDIQEAQHACAYHIRGLQKALWKGLENSSGQVGLRRGPRAGLFQFKIQYPYKVQEQISCGYRYGFRSPVDATQIFHCITDPNENWKQTLNSCINPGNNPQPIFFAQTMSSPSRAHTAHQIPLTPLRQVISFGRPRPKLYIYSESDTEREEAKITLGDTTQLSCPTKQPRQRLKSRNQI